MRISAKNGWPLLLCGVLAVALVYGQDEKPKPPPGPKWEYRLLEWNPEDTETIVRRLTGQPLGSLDDLVPRLAEETEAQHFPGLQAAIDQRLAERLQEAGQEGWEAFWVRNNGVAVGGHLLPLPNVLLKRRPSG